MAEKKVEWLEGCYCTCGQQLNSWDKRCSKALKYKYVICEKCIAKEYDMEVETFRSKMEDWFGMRPCMGI